MTEETRQFWARYERMKRESGTIQKHGFMQQFNLPPYIRDGVEPVPAPKTTPMDVLDLTYSDRLFLQDLKVGA